MVGCSAKFCRNTTETGVRFYSFPRNPSRLALWIEKVNRPGWSPKPGNKLCEVHFKQDQFENKRMDGRKLLKWTAVPTIFEANQASRKADRMPAVVSKPGSMVNEGNQVPIFDPNFFSSIDKLCSLGLSSYENQCSRPLLTFNELRSRIERVTLHPGVMKEVINLFIRRLNLETENPQYCVVSLDVYPVDPKIQYDNTDEMFVGCVSSTAGAAVLKIAKQIAVLTVKGLKSGWKCIAGYMFINYDENLKDIWDLLNKLVLFLGENNLYVLGIVLGQHCGYDILHNNLPDEARENVCIEHPLIDNTMLCFMKDVDSIVDELSESILRYQICFPGQFLEMFNLSDSTFNVEYLKNLVGNDVLTEQLVARWLLQEGNLELLNMDPLNQTTGFFLQTLKRWIMIIKNTLDRDALSTESLNSEDKIQFLRDVLNIFQLLEVHEHIIKLKQVWGSLKDTTTAFLYLYDTYVLNGTLNITEICSFQSTNLQKFKDIVNGMDVSLPTPMKIFSFLRIVNTGLLLDASPGGAGFESGLFLVQFLERRRLNVPVDLREPDDLSDMDGQGIYYVSSSVITKFLRENKCEKCEKALVIDSVSSNLPIEWTSAVENRGFHHPSPSVYDVLQWAECHILNTEEALTKLDKARSQLAFRVYGEMAVSIRSVFPSCHDTLRNILSLFVGIRLQMMADDFTKCLS